MKHALKLIIVAIAVCTVLGFTITITGKGIRLVSKDGGSIDPVEKATATVVDGLEENKFGFRDGINHSFTVMKDLFNFVFKGEESQYQSGIDAILGDDHGNDEDFVGMVLEKGKETIDEAKDKIDKGEFIVVGDMSGLDDVTLIHVIDGDTLLVDDDGEEIRVRLIGIDTPESVNPDEEKNTVWGTIASDYTKSLLEEGETLYLEYDKDKDDDYGRTLAYVWVSEDVHDISNMLNTIIIGNGYADVLTIKPNDKYATEFKTLREWAASENKGLWADQGYRDYVQGAGQ